MIIPTLSMRKTEAQRGYLKLPKATAPRSLKPWAAPASSPRSTTVLGGLTRGDACVPPGSSLGSFGCS